MPFHVEIDAEHGGRWTSLVDGAGREWLWSRPDAARSTVRPGQPFVDAGGVEECFPTIGGSPDHGDVWTRPWHRDGAWLRVECEDALLSRRVGTTADAVVVDYQLEAEPARHFIWAFHALLQPATGTRVIAPSGHPVRAWPDHVRLLDTTWPGVLGKAGYDVLAPDDGTAMFCLLPGLDTVGIEVDGARLRFRLECEEQPVSVGVWRNLGGYPWDGAPKYRNFGIEPMLGRVFDLSAAADDDAAVVPTSGMLTWRLVIDTG